MGSGAVRDTKSDTINLERNVSIRCWATAVPRSHSYSYRGSRIVNHARCTADSASLRPAGYIRRYMLIFPRISDVSLLNAGNRAPLASTVSQYHYHV